MLKLLISMAVAAIVVLAIACGGGVTVTAGEYGRVWPLKVEEAELFCAAGGAALWLEVSEHRDRQYPLTYVAATYLRKQDRNAAVGNLDTLRRERPDSPPGQRLLMSVVPLQEQARKICGR